MKSHFFRFLGTVLAVSICGSTTVLAGSAITGTVTAKKKKYIKNTVVYLEKVPGVHKPTKPATIDQKDQTFIPFVTPIVVGTKVRFLNSDNMVHNVFSPSGEKYDLGNWDKGGVRTRIFKKKGVYKQLCKLHPAMRAYVIVLQNPYFAVTKKDGSFTIANVPGGTYKLAVWNKRKKAAPMPVKVDAKGKKIIEIKLR